MLAVSLLAALSSVTVGAALQNVMPTFANILRPRLGAEAAYGILMFVLGAGAVIGGFLLEATGWLPARLSLVLVPIVLFSGFVVMFPLSPALVVAVIAVIGVGMAQITNEATGMAIVQLQAPKDDRGVLLSGVILSVGALVISAYARAALQSPGRPRTE